MGIPNPSLFDHYLNRPDDLPGDWRAEAGAPGSRGTARLVADYIAGMTDRFALEECRRLPRAGAERSYA